MRCTLERPSQGGDQAGVLIGDHQLDPAESAGLQRPEEVAPVRLVLAVADVAAQDLSVPVCGDAGGHDDGHRGDLRCLVADVEVRGVEVDVGELDVIEGAGSERADDLIESGADP